MASEPGDERLNATSPPLRDGDDADETVRVHGGYGYVMEFPAQRAWRDARLGPIGVGTTEIMKEIIGRSYGL